MARALVVTGLDPERAYLIARRADRDLADRGAVSLDLDRLGELAAEPIGEEEAARTVRGLRRLDARGPQAAACRGVGGPGGAVAPARRRCDGNRQVDDRHRSRTPSRDHTRDV